MRAAALDATFAALADPTRRAIVTRLTRGEATVSRLAEPFAISLPAVSKHLRVLEEAGLLARRQDGRLHRCRLDPGPLKDAAAWLARYERFWEGHLDALAHYLQTADRQEDTRWRRRSRSSGSSPRRARRSSAPGRTQKR